MKTGINIEQAKKGISIVSYLALHGHQPVGMQGKEHKYFSPFREEKTPSMFVNDEKGVFNDFGFDSGDVVRLAMQLHNFSTISATLQHLSAYVSGSIVQTITPQKADKTLFDSPKTNISRVRVRPLNHFVLLKYLREERGITAAIAQKYLKFVLYDNKGRKDLFAIGWENDSGAFELRSAGKQNFKTVTGRKDISTISKKGNENRCFVFESMLDFLSVLELKNQDSLTGTVFILNSNSLIKRVSERINDANFETVFTLFDNDRGGEKALENLQKLTNHSDIRPQNFYDGYNDVNDFLVKKTS